MENLGEWIKAKYKTQGALAAELGIQQSRISKWLGGEPIPKAFQAKLRELKYKGPWPKETAGDAQDAPADFTSREDHWKLVGRVDTLERRLEDALTLIRDLKLKGP